jgi:hypothetical protein
LQSQPKTLRRHIVARELGIELPERFRLDPSPWHAVVSSRLGKNLIGRRTEIAWMRHAIEKANHRGDRSLIVRDTAAASWAERACELLGFDPVRLAIEDSKEPWQKMALPVDVCRDKLCIALADRIDAAYVRPGGTVYRLLRERIAQDTSPTVQVLLTQQENDATQQLIAAGAIGYWLGQPTRDESIARVDGSHLDLSSHVSGSDSPDARSLFEAPERWLIHSTRQRTGPWPGQSKTQFNDWLLLSPPVHEQPSPLETLNRIVHERRLVGSHRTTQSKEPVVCFTSLAIDTWLARRRYRSHLGRWDCEPYGVAINREAAMRLGISPVIYGDPAEVASIEEHDRWRFQATGSTFDWREEREWRARGIVDLKRFADDEVVVFVKEPGEVPLVINSPWPVISVHHSRQSLHRS